MDLETKPLQNINGICTFSTCIRGVFRLQNKHHTD